MFARRKNELNRILRKGMRVKKQPFPNLKKLSTAMEPHECCTHLKCSGLYNALSLIKIFTVELAAKFKLNSIGLN